MNVSVITKEGWLDSWQMHRAYAKTFHELRPAHLERPDFVLFCEYKERPCGFVTCIEMDSETVYWQFGGLFDEVKSTIAARSAISGCIEKMREKGFKRISTRVENTNLRMLRLEMKFGFLVVGTYTFKNKIYLELVNELGE